MGNVFTLTPPLTIGEDDLERALDIFDTAIAMSADTLDGACSTPAHSP